MYVEDRTRSEVGNLAERLYRDWRRLLLAIARRNAASYADADEAINEAFVSFICHFDPDRGAPPMAWLILTLKRECWRKHRREHWERRAGQESERGGEELGAVLESLPCLAPGPEQRVIEAEGARARLAYLKPDQRMAFLLRAAGYSYREIAEHRGWTYSKVDRCIRRGRGRLRAAEALG